MSVTMENAENILKIYEISEKAKLAMLESEFRKYHKQRFDNGEYDDEHFMIKQCRTAMIKEKEKNMYWMTINPKPDTPLEKFKLIITAFLKRKMVLSYHYALEQRGKTNETMGEGIHVHILMYSYDRKPHIIRNTYSTFKSIIGSKESIDVKKYPSDYHSEKLQYLNGTKWDDEKEDSVKINNQWRINNNIDSVYNNL